MVSIILGRSYHADLLISIMLLLKGAQTSWLTAWPGCVGGPSFLRLRHCHTDSGSKWCHQDGGARTQDILAFNFAQRGGRGGVAAIFFFLSQWQTNKTATRSPQIWCDPPLIHNQRSNSSSSHSWHFLSCADLSFHRAEVPSYWCFWSHTGLQNWDTHVKTIMMINNRQRRNMGWTVPLSIQSTQSIQSKCCI